MKRLTAGVSVSDIPCRLSSHFLDVFFHRNIITLSQDEYMRTGHIGGDK